MDPFTMATMAAIGAGVGGLNSIFKTNAEQKANQAANEKARIDALNYAWTGYMPDHVPQEADGWGNLLGGLTGGALTGAQLYAANSGDAATNEKTWDNVLEQSKASGSIPTNATAVGLTGSPLDVKSYSDAVQSYNKPWGYQGTVSYTHLTLPTKRIV